MNNILQKIINKISNLLYNFKKLFDTENLR